MDPAWKGWKQKPTWRLGIAWHRVRRMPPFPFRSFSICAALSWCFFLWHSALVRGFGSWVRPYNLRPQRLRSHEGFLTLPAFFNSKESSVPGPKDSPSKVEITESFDLFFLRLLCDSYKFLHLRQFLGLATHKSLLKQSSKSSWLLTRAWFSYQGLATLCASRKNCVG